MEINVDLPISVYWRLARTYSHLVSGTTINTGEIRGEYLRILDQGRGVDKNRLINSFQNQSILAHNHKWGLGTRRSNELPISSHPQFAASLDADNGIGLRDFDDYNSSLPPSAIKSIVSCSTTDFGGEANNVRNIARPMAIAIAI